MGVIIFLHGSGDTGEGIRSWLAHFRYREQHPAHRFIFPTATPIPYSLFGGELSIVWFDRTSLALDGQEQTKSVEHSMRRIDAMIDDLIRDGTPPKDIVLGGFSQGGCLALQVALTGKHAGTLGGVFAFSSFLYSSTVLDHGNGRSDKDTDGDLDEDEDGKGETGGVGSEPSLPVLMTHGETDGMIPLASGQATAARLSALAQCRVEFCPIPGLQHEFDQRCLDKLTELLRRVFNGDGSN